MSKVIILKIEPKNDVFIFGSYSNKQQFTAYTIDELGKKVDVTKFVNWESSDSSVIEIDSNGLGDVKKVGEPNIKATFNGISTSVKFTIRNLVSIKIDNKNLQVQENETLSFGASVTLEDGKIIDITDKVEWSTSNEGVAVINNKGVLSVVQYEPVQSQVIVYAKYLNKRESALVTVRESINEPIDSIKIFPNSVVIDANISKNQVISAKATYASGFTEDITAKAIWTIGDESIAKINDRGIITGLSNGTTTININKNGWTASIPLEVQNAEKKMVSLEIEPKSFILPWQDGYSTLQYKALAVMSNDEIIDVTTATTWASTQPIVAPISMEGLARSKTRGITSITASYGGFESRTDLTTGATLTHIEIQPRDVSFEVETAYKFEAIAHYSDFPSQVVTNHTKWVSSDKYYLNVLTTGLVYGERVGKANLRAYYYGSTDEVKLTVHQAPIYIDGLAIIPNKVDIALEFGNTAQFKAEAIYSDETTQDITEIAKWSVSDTDVASIDDKGFLTVNTVLVDTDIEVSIEYKEKTVKAIVHIKPVPLPDITPPGSITNIRQESTDTTITFNFRLPNDIDFYSVKVYRDDIYIGETLVGRFVDTGLQPRTNYVYKFSTVDKLNNESTPISYRAVTLAKGQQPKLEYREPLEWTGNIIVNQNNQVYSNESNSFPINDTSDQTSNQYLVTWSDVKCPSCESIYQMLRNHTPLSSFKANGWEYVLVAEANNFTAQAIHEIKILHYMKADELQFGAWCRQCGSVVYSKVYLKEYDSRVELGMTFFPSEQVIPKYTFKLPSQTKIEVLNNNSIGKFLIYEPISKTFEEIPLITVMPSEHLVKRDGVVFAKVLLNPNMNEVSVQFMNPEGEIWEKEVSYILSINKKNILNLNTVDEFDVLQVAAWENKPDGTPTKLHSTYVGYNILFNYAQHENDSSNGTEDFDPEWPPHEKEEIDPPDIVLEGIKNLYGWGDNEFGQIGNGNKLEIHTPTETLATDILQVAAGKHHSIAIQRNGYLLAWGRNSNGQLGHGTKDSYYHHTPKVIKDLDHMIDVAAGWFHSLGLERDGTVWAWGGNYKGQLGDNTVLERSTPVQVRGPKGGNMFLENIIKIGAGSDFSVALDKFGKVWQWGRDTLVPEQVAKLEDIVDIATGAWHTLALKQDGTVWAWGYNWSGQLGIGVWEYENGYTPNNEYNDVLQVQNLSNIVAIAAGNDHSLALTEAGTIFAWGDNDHGQIGTTVNRNKYWPIEIPSIKDIISIAAGEYSTYAIRNDKTYWAWGDNSNGVLGDGTMEKSNIPKEISTIAGWDVEKIEAGRGHALAVKVLPGKK